MDLRFKLLRTHNLLGCWLKLHSRPPQQRFLYLLGSSRARRLQCSVGRGCSWPGDLTGETLSGPPGLSQNRSYSAASGMPTLNEVRARKSGPALVSVLSL